MIERVNIEDRVNTWMHCLEPFEIDDDYYLIIPIVDFFHFEEDLLDYYDRGFFQDESDDHKVLTINNMAPSKEEFESYTCLERSELDGVILSAEVSSHGQNGLHFHDLKVFKSEAGVIGHYKNLNYAPPSARLLPVEGHFLSDGEKIISHNDAELVELFDRYITPRLKK